MADVRSYPGPDRGASDDSVRSDCCFSFRSGPDQHVDPSAPQNLKPLPSAVVEINETVTTLPSVPTDVEATQLDALKS